jgi:polyphosphate kinase
VNTNFDPELARLDFEDRLVALCEDSDLPLLERARLLGIAAGRVDVFFMTRVGRLKRLLAAREATDDDLKILAWQLDAVTRETHLLTGRIYRLLTDDLLPALAAEGIRIEQLDALDRDDRDALVSGQTSAPRSWPCAATLRTGWCSPNSPPTVHGSCGCATRTGSCHSSR